MSHSQLRRPTGIFGPIKATLYVVVSVLSYSLLHLLHPLIPPLLYQCGLQVQAAPITSFIKPND